MLLKIEEMKEKISQLNESEAKSLLLMIYARLDTAMNWTGGNDVIEQTVKDLYATYCELPGKE